MTIKLRTLALVLILQLLGLAAVALSGALAAAGWQAALDRTRDESAVTEGARLIERQSGLLERAAIELAALGELLHALSRRDDAWHALLQSGLLAHVERLPEAVGGGLWFEPGAVQPERRYYGPYVFRDDGGLAFTWDLSTPEYDYFSQHWYLAGLPRDWPRERRRPSSSYWSEPYRDAAATQALMLTVSAPMHDGTGRVLGLATVDWSLEAMRGLVARLGRRGGQHTLLVDQRSGRFLVYSPDPGQVMRQAALQPWLGDLLPQVRSNEPPRHFDVELAGVSHDLHMAATPVGLVVGLLSPQPGRGEALLSALRGQLPWVLGVAVLFMLLMSVLLQRLFRPFDRVLAAITASVRRDPVAGHLVLSPIQLRERSEFSPIIAALNEVYAEISRDADRLAELNRQLQHRQADIEAQNASLEQRVNQRTFELEANNAELQRSVAALSRLQDQLVEAEKQGALSRLVAGIAHDINTPLGIAVTAASHLQDVFTGQREDLQRAAQSAPGLARLQRDADEALRILLGNLQRAAGLVRSFKQISVDQSGEGRRRFDLAAYLDDVLLSLRPQFKRLPHTVNLDCPRGIELDSFPGAWAQIVTNLLLNALRHGLSAERPGTVRIIAREDGDEVDLRVMDDGVGIPEERQSRIFEAFFTTGASQGGTGLGLAVVRDLVEQRLGGSIEVRSTPGEGCEFRIRAPRRTAEPAQG